MVRQSLDERKRATKLGYCTQAIFNLIADMYDAQYGWRLREEALWQNPREIIQKTAHCIALIQIINMVLLIHCTTRIVAHVRIFFYFRHKKGG